MSNAIKIGDLTIDSFKVGAADCSIYLGTTKLYPTEEPQNFKYKLTLSDSSTITAQCDSTSAIAESEVSIPYKNTLVETEIGNCVTSIGAWAFDSCTGLTSVTIPDSVTSFGMGAFSTCRGLTSIHIPNGITTIESMTFYACTSLTSIDIPNSVTSIGDTAFSACSGLTSLTIPDSVTSIGSQAFGSCSSLTSVTIGSGVTSIDYMAFRYCSSLTSVTVNATTPPTLGSNAFDNTSSNMLIYVPTESLEAYKQASGWSDFSSRIQPIT